MTSTTPPPPTTPPHVVLLGDSVFDNGVYVPGEPDVAAQLRAELGAQLGARVTLLAVDGDVTAGVRRQLAARPADATHLVVSVGGNDALGHAHLLGAGVGTVAEALDLLGEARERFAAEYADMLDEVRSTGLPVAVCTVYDTRLVELGLRVVRAAVALFDDAITRAAFARGTTVLDLRLVCDEDADYANPIEPSAHGGRKIARTIAAWVRGEGARRSEVLA